MAGPSSRARSRQADSLPIARQNIPPQRHQVETDNVQTDTLTGWRFGLGFGLSSLNYFPDQGDTDDFSDFSFRVPAFTLFVALNEKWFFEALWGVRPVLGVFSKTSAPAYTGDTSARRENVAAFHVSHYFTEARPDEIGISLGGALGYQLAWDVIPEFDEFVKRASGFTAGGRVRVGGLPKRIAAVLGLDFQSSDLSEFGTPGELTNVAGLVLSVTFNYVF